MLPGTLICNQQSNGKKMSCPVSRILSYPLGACWARLRDARPRHVEISVLVPTTPAHVPNPIQMCEHNTLPRAVNAAGCTGQDIQLLKAFAYYNVTYMLLKHPLFKPVTLLEAAPSEMPTPKSPASPAAANQRCPRNDLELPALPEHLRDHLRWACLTALQKVYCFCQNGNTTGKKMSLKQRSTLLRIAHSGS